MLHRVLRHLADVVVPLLHAQAPEAHRRLATPTMLLRQVHREPVQHRPRVAGQRPVQGLRAVHNNEAELVLLLQQLLQRLRVELVVALVQRRVDCTAELA